MYALADVGFRDLFETAGPDFAIWVVAPLTPAQQRLMDTLCVPVRLMTSVTDEGVRCAVGDCGWRFVGTAKQAEVAIERHRLEAHPWVTPGRLAARVERDANRDALAALDAAIPQREIAELPDALDETRYCLAPSCEREAEQGGDYCRVCRDQREHPLASLPVGKPVDEKTVEVSLPKEKNPKHKGRKPFYTREIVVARLQAYVTAHDGHVPTFTQFADAKELPSESVLKRLGWKFADAVEAAGYPRPVVGVTRSHPEGEWTRERILELLKDDAARLGRTPSATDWRLAFGRCSDRYVLKLFDGKWNNAVVAAGLTPRRAGITVAADAVASPERGNQGDDSGAALSQPRSDEATVEVAADTRDRGPGWPERTGILADDDEPTVPAVLVATERELVHPLLDGDTDEWIEKLNQESVRLKVEAARLMRRAEGVGTIVEGLKILRETEL